MKLFVSITISFLAFIANASAEEAQASQTNGGAREFLESMVGEYRGRGEVLVGPARSQERVSCKLSNNFDAAALALAINGKCATTQGRVDVDGTLKMNDDKNIVGSFLSTSKDSEITQSSGSFSNGSLTLSMSMISKRTGDLSKTRQVVSRNSEGGFSSVFYKYDNASKSYLETGKVNFTPSGG